MSAFRTFGAVVHRNGTEGPSCVPSVLRDPKAFVCRPGAMSRTNCEFCAEVRRQGSGVPRQELDGVFVHEWRLMPNPVFRHPAANPSAPLVVVSRARTRDE